MGQTSVSSDYHTQVLTNIARKLSSMQCSNHVICVCIWIHKLFSNNAYKFHTLVVLSYISHNLKPGKVGNLFIVTLISFSQIMKICCLHSIFAESLSFGIN